MLKHLLLSLILCCSIFLVRCGLREKIAAIKDFRFNKTITVDGLNRTYRLNLPPTYYENSDLPLVIALHGGGGSADQCETDYGLTIKANAENYIIVYPEGVQSDGILKVRTWNAGTCCDYAVEKNIDDVHFISVLIDDLVKNYKINSKKVYLTGMSNGAILSYRLACEIPNKITAIAAVSGPLSLKQACQSTKPIPIMHLHSVLDQKVPFNGGTGILGNTFPAVAAGLTTWSKINECKTLAKVIKDDSKYKLTQWLDCKNNAIITYYLTKDGGHSWPGSVKVRAAADEPSTVINANDLIFEFFKQF
jgi:polyhydroxybutyrate depolymerase